MGERRAELGASIVSSLGESWGWWRFALVIEGGIGVVVVQIEERSRLE